MARGGSGAKLKGSSFERDMAQKLSELTGESFIRAPSSGAYIGGFNSSRKEVLHEGQIRTFKGDIIPGESYSRWNIECKSYSDFPFYLLLQNKEIAILDQWIEQMMSVADDDDINLLLMKFNRKGIYVLHDKSLIESTTGITYKDVWNMDFFTNVSHLLASKK
jgi:Holliday junction resolvase